MIVTIADLLEKFKEYAITKIDENEKDVNHRPTIGNIFEGVAAKLLDKAIFKGLDLKNGEMTAFFKKMLLQNT